MSTIKKIATVAFNLRENEFLKEGLQSLLVSHFKSATPEYTGSVSREAEFVRAVESVKFSPSIKRVVSAIVAAKSVEEVEATLNKVRLV